MSKKQRLKAKRVKGNTGGYARRTGYATTTTSKPSKASGYGYGYGYGYSRPISYSDRIKDPTIVQPQDDPGFKKEMDKSVSTPVEEMPSPIIDPNDPSELTTEEQQGAIRDNATSMDSSTTPKDSAFAGTTGTAPTLDYDLPRLRKPPTVEVDDIRLSEKEFADAEQIGKRGVIDAAEADAEDAIMRQGYAKTGEDVDSLQASTAGYATARSLEGTKAATQERYQKLTPKDVLEMAVGLKSMDLRYDANGDGKVTSSDALYFTKNPEALEAIENKRASEESTRTAEEMSIEDVTGTAATRDTEAEKKAKAKTIKEFNLDPNSLVPEVNAEGIPMSPSKEAATKIRKALTEDDIPEGTAAQIEDIVGFDAAQRKTVKGKAAKGAAADMIAAVGNLPPEISATIVENPAEVTAQLDEQPVEVRAAIAALPTEALVSTQLETLLAGIEDGETPIWARAAVQAVDTKMAARGLNISSIGRDALFNAIIQTAFPIAQANATALQRRASENLSNEQQANMATSELDMRRRMTNLANRQQAESQSAQMSQQMATLQSQFNQQATMASAQQRQQTEMQNLANRQEAAKVTSLNEQAIKAQELSNEQQVELAQMQYMNATEKENMSAKQQAKLAEFQVAADFMSKNAAFKQQMEIANISEESKIKLANLQSRNLAASQTLSNAEKTELANLNARVQENITAANIAKTMGVAQLNVDQQRAVQNATTTAKLDMAKFSNEQQVEIANSKFMQTATLSDFNARQQTAVQNATLAAQVNLAEASENARIRVSNAQNFLKMDMTNLANRQQAVVLDQQLEQQRLLSDQSAENAAKQFNAQSQNQVNMFMRNLGQDLEKFNVAQQNAMSQFNAAEVSKSNAMNANRQADVSKFNAELLTRNAQFNSEVAFKRDQWNAANAQAVAQANIEWRRQSNTINTAAQNAANQKTAQMAFSMSSMEQDFVWQMLRDEAKYIRDSYENEEGRKAALYSVALQNEAAAGKSEGATSNLLKFVADIFMD